MLHMLSYGGDHHDVCPCPPMFFLYGNVTDGHCRNYGLGPVFGWIVFSFFFHMVQRKKSVRSYVSRLLAGNTGVRPKPKRRQVAGSVVLNDKVAYNTSAGINPDTGSKTQAKTQGLKPTMN